MTRAVRTYGLTHLALLVRDPERSLRFYARVFGMKTVYHSPGFIQAQTPGSHDVLVFQKRPRGRSARPGPGGASRGIAHFGFRLEDPGDIAAAAAVVRAAGGTVREQGEFCPGEPYLFFTDPDGNEVEIWYEPPTPIDPPSRRGGARRAPKSRARASGRG